MKNYKKIGSRLLCIMLVMIMVLTPSVAQAAKVKISAKKISLKVGQKKTLTVKKGKKKVKGVKWQTSNKKVATVKAGKVTAKKVGTATITAKVGKKKYSCKVTVKPKKVTTKPVTPTNPTTQPTTSPTSATYIPVPINPTTSVIPTYNPTAPTTTEPITEPTEATSSFSFEEDVTIEYGTKTVYIEFEMKEEEGEKEELEELGFTIDEESGTASKNQLCETAKYTFKELPTTPADIETFFANAEPENYGGFNAMAATICAACTFKGGSNPSDPFFSKDPVREMFEYINGPATSMDIANAQMDNAIVSMKQAIQSCGSNVYKSYFNGADYKNNYTPNEPYVLEMYRGPYYIEEKDTITGTRPTTYMILVKSGGADTEKYIDVYYSTKMDRWFSYENQFMHVIANDFRVPEEEL